MRLSLKERESFRKRVQNLLPQMKKSQIVEHFFKEGTTYDTIKRLEFGKPIEDKKRTGRPTSWTPAKKSKLAVHASV